MRAQRSSSSVALDSLPSRVLSVSGQHWKHHSKEAGAGVRDDAPTWQAGPQSAESFWS